MTNNITKGPGFYAPLLNIALADIPGFGDSVSVVYRIRNRVYESWTKDGGSFNFFEEAKADELLLIIAKNEGDFSNYFGKANTGNGGPVYAGFETMDSQPIMLLPYNFSLRYILINQIGAINQLGFINSNAGNSVNVIINSNGAAITLFGNTDAADSLPSSGYILLTWKNDNNTLKWTCENPAIT